MDIKNLRSFQQVAERSSFTAAAQALGYSQSTISFQIKQLEEELGVLLFERINHTIFLTDEGQKLLDYAHKVLQLSDEFHQGLQTPGQIEGSVHIVTPDSICESMMLAHYTNFYRLYPNISLRFSTADTSYMFELLDRNEADVIQTLDSHVYSNQYVIAKEERAPMHFVTGVQSPFAGIRGLSIRELSREPFILTEKNFGYRRVLDRELAKLSIDIHPILEIGRTDIITTMLSQGIGVSFLPDFVTSAAVKAGKLTYLDVTDVEIEVWKQLIYHKNKWISRSLRAFLDYVIQTEFQSHP